jgi:hypothetical protein
MPLPVTPTGATGRLAGAEAVLDHVPRAWVRASLLQMAYRDLGMTITVQPALLPGGHTWVTVEGCGRMSLSAAEALLEVVSLKLARCAHCGGSVTANGLVPGRQRRTRFDTRYCGSPCRQAAYRQRTHAAQTS